MNEVLEKLHLHLESTGQTIKSFSQKSGIPDARLYKMLKRRHINPKVSTSDAAKIDAILKESPVEQIDPTTDVIEKPSSDLKLTLTTVALVAVSDKVLVEKRALEFPEVIDITIDAAMARLRELKKKNCKRFNDL